MIEGASNLVQPQFDSRLRNEDDNSNLEDSLSTIISINSDEQENSRLQSNIPENIEIPQDPIPHESGQTTQGKQWTVYNGNANTVLKTLPDDFFQCAITSPPYFWLRDYGAEGQIGMEWKIDEYVQAIADVMDQVKRVLAHDGVFFLNIGDTYYSGKGESQGVDKKSRKRRFGLRAVDASGLGIPQKSLIGIPWRVAIEMISRGWVLRSSIIWDRLHSLPESVQDRPGRTYEHIFMFVKSRKYYFNREALNGEKDDVWTIKARPKPTPGISTAPYPDELLTVRAFLRRF